MRDVDQGSSTVGQETPPIRPHRSSSICGLVFATLLVAACGGSEEDNGAGGREWVSLGLSGQDLTAILVNPVAPRILYVATPSSLQKSVDAGATWTSDGAAGFSGPVAMDPFHPETLVSAVNYVGFEVGSALAMTTDGGTNWHQLEQELTDFDFLHAITFSRSAPAFLYAVVDEPAPVIGGAYQYLGLIRSRDGGVSFRKPAQRGVSKLYSLAVDPTNPRILYAVADRLSNDPHPVLKTGVAKSVDEGETWQLTQGPYSSCAAFFPYPRLLPTESCLAVDPTNPSQLYVLTYEGISRSLNGGASWTDASVGLGSTTALVFETQALAVAPTNPSTLYVGTSDGVFQSTDGGRQWSPIGPSGLSVTSVAIDPANPARVYAGTAGAGLFVMQP
jgi:hypothetical protein